MTNDTPSSRHVGNEPESLIYVPARGPEDFQALLEDPVKHWRTGYSAKSLAYSWWEASGFPEEIRNVFSASDSPAIRNLAPLVIIPEHKVNLPGGDRASQNDVFVLAKGDGALCSIAVEGKVREAFGPLVEEWLGEAPSRGKIARLQFLVDTLGIDGGAIGGIRYQLLHRTASALLEAERFTAASAMMLVHSFSQDDTHFGDYANFLELFGVNAVLNAVQGPVARNGKRLHFCWVRGNAEYLTR